MTYPTKILEQKEKKEIRWKFSTKLSMKYSTEERGRRSSTKGPEEPPKGKVFTK